jgi:hypothetical protein
MNTYTQLTREERYLNKLKGQAYTLKQVKEVKGSGLYFIADRA